jgi:hypothetical protein
LRMAFMNEVERCLEVVHSKLRGASKHRSNVVQFEKDMAEARKFCEMASAFHEEWYKEMNGSGADNS